MTSIVSLATAATGGAILIRWAGGARNPRSRTTPSSTAFSNGWTHPRDNSRSRQLDLVFDALEHAGVDARQRKIVWADGKRLSIEQSAERIHAGHPDVACDVIKLTCWVGWKAVRRKPTPSANSRNSTGSSNRGSTTMSARHAPSESSRELGTLEFLMKQVFLAGMGASFMEFVKHGGKSAHIGFSSHWFF